MKISLILTIIVLVFSGCSTAPMAIATNTDTVITARVDSESGPVNEDYLKLKAAPWPKTSVEDRSKIGNVKIDTYWDDKLIKTEVFRDGLRRHYTGYFDDGKIETELEEFYTKDGSYDDTKVVKSDNYDDSEDGQVFYKKLAFDDEFEREHLVSVGIAIPPAVFSGNDVQDMSQVLFRAEDKGLKPKVVTRGNLKTLKYIGLNEVSNFRNSQLSTFFHLNELTGFDAFKVKDYELTLRNNYPWREVYRTEFGICFKKYSYKGDLLVEATTQCPSLKEDNIFVAKFKYTPLD
jgi:hypothetical protein